MAKCNVVIIHEVIHPGHPAHDWQLCLHWCRYRYSDSTSELGYRFMWRRPDGSLQPARGQARLPSRHDVDLLFGLAKHQGWGDLDDTEPTGRPVDATV